MVYNKFFLILFFLFVSGLTANASDNADESKSLQPVSLQLNWRYQFEFAGFIAAKEKGFYADSGLDVDLKEYKPGMNVVDEVLSGNATYGVSNSSTLIEYLKGRPVVLVSSFFKRAAVVLIVKPYIKTPKELIGKKMMSTSKENLMLNFRPYFLGYGVHLSDMTLVKHSFDVKAFADGSVDAMTAYISDEPYKLGKLGVKYKILDPSNDNLFIMQNELFSSKKEIQKHPKRVRAFREASIKGWRYALAHKKELVKIIHEKYAPDIPEDALLYEAKAIDKLILPYIYDIGSIDVNFLHKQIRRFQKEYNIGKNRDLDGYIFRSNKDTLKLSEEEKCYINTHETIPVCINYDSFPVDGYEDGNYIGMMADLYKIIEEKTGLKFVPIRSESRFDLARNIEEKRCKIFSITATKSDIFKTLKMTSPIEKVYFTLITTLDKSFVYSPSALKNKLLLVKNKPFKDYLNNLYPYLNIEIEYDKKKRLEKLLQHRAYAIVTVDEEADYFIDKYGYGKLKINGFLAKDHKMEVSIGVQRDEPVLYSILQKSIKLISPQQIQSIISRWRLTRYHEVVNYSLVWQVVLVMGVILLVMIYYQRKLKRFNHDLEGTVYNKTKELRELNNSLEATVQEKVNELVEKDEILTRQSKQAVMGEMLSMIAHQWRQPLNTISLKISNIQLDEMLSHSVTKEQLLKVLDDINNTIQYLSATIDDFKTYFQPNKNTVHTTTKDMLQKTMALLDARVKKENIEIQMEKIDNTPLNIYESEMIQVLLNIINNAIDAYLENKEETNRRIVIRTLKADKKIKIMIRDYAGGIEPEIKNKLFEPYFSTKDKNGTGLGLYMSKMILEKQFHGTIDVQTKANSTTFIIEIPTDLKNI